MTNFVEENHLFERTKQMKWRRSEKIQNYRQKLKRKKKRHTGLECVLCIETLELRDK
jgi:hypothetical protein